MLATVTTQPKLSFRDLGVGTFCCRGSLEVDARESSGIKVLIVQASRMASAEVRV